MRLLAWAAIVAFVFQSNGTAQEDISQIKTLAPGVLKVIPTNMDSRDSYSNPMNLPGLSADEYQPNFAPKSDTLKVSGERTILFRDVWQNEFAFTGLRQVNVLMRYPDGTEKRKNFWYMVYRLRDLGKSLSYEQNVDEFGHVNNRLVRDAARTNRALAAQKLQMHFTLNGMIQSADGKGYEKVSYGDMSGDARTQAIAKYIQSVEDPNQKLHHKGELETIKLPLAESDTDPGVWGVAIFENVDPSIDFVSVNVRGLTNAYRIQESADGEVDFVYKTLQLNFWRAGDEVGEIRDDVEYGIPLVDRPDVQVEICRNYDLPAPILRGYLISEKTKNNIPIAKLDAQVNFVDFTSLLTPKMDIGEVPREVSDAFAQAGIDMAGATLTTQIPGERWTFEADGMKYLIRFEPQFWKRAGKGIDFTRTLDHFWIYR